MTVLKVCRGRTMAAILVGASGFGGGMVFIPSFLDAAPARTPSTLIASGSARAVTYILLWLSVSFLLAVRSGQPAGNLIRRTGKIFTVSLAPLISYFPYLVHRTSLEGESVEVPPLSPTFSAVILLLWSLALLAVLLRLTLGKKESPLLAKLTRRPAVTLAIMMATWLVVFFILDLLKEARQVKRDWLAGALSDPDAAGSAATFETRLDTLTANALDNKDAENLRQRFVTHRDANFTFLRYRDVEPDNNRAERALRPSVVARKVSYGSNSVLGAWNHETIMSLLETARLHRIEPLDVFMDLAKGEMPRALDAVLTPKAPTPATPATQPVLADLGVPAGTHAEPGAARERAPPA